jgi:hypothetical protein
VLVVSEGRMDGLRAVGMESWKHGGKPKLFVSSYNN